MSKQSELSRSELLKIGEFTISQYTDDSLLISKEDESMEVSLNTFRRFYTLRRFWDENY